MAEEDEAAVTIDIKADVVEGKALGDGGFHLANRTRSGRIEIDKGAVLAVHDEVAFGAAAF